MPAAWQRATQAGSLLGMKADLGREEVNEA